MDLLPRSDYLTIRLIRAASPLQEIDVEERVGGDPLEPEVALGLSIR